MVKTNLAYAFEYKRSIDCWLSFTSTDENEPLRICRLDQILEGRIEFKKSSISYEEKQTKRDASVFQENMCLQIVLHILVYT